MTKNQTIPSLPRLAYAFILIGLLLLMLAGTVSLAQAAPPSQDEENGDSIFKAKCAGCHTVGGGDLVGPDLAGVTERRDRAWLTRWLKEPDKMQAEGDPIATELMQKYNNIPMPNLGLTDAEVAALITYFESEFYHAEVQAPQAPILPPGDSIRGRGMFTGLVRFENGGPACMSCHSVAGIGVLGGGALGPDLTGVLDRYGWRKGLNAFLTNPATTTMNAVWVNQPLTEQERADLIVFLEASTATARPTSALVSLAGLSGGSMVVLIVAAQLFWRKRSNGVRKPMIARANAKK